MPTDKEEIALLKTAVQELRSQITSLSPRVERLDALDASLAVIKVKALPDAVDALAADVSNAVARLTALEAAHVDNAPMAQRLSATVDNLVLCLAQHSTALTGLSELDSELDRRVRDLAAKLVKLDADLSRRVSLLDAELVINNVAMETYAERTDANERGLRAHEATVKKLEGVVSSALEKLFRASTTLSTLRDAIASIRQDISKIRGKL